MRITAVELYPVEVLCLHPGGPAQPDIRPHVVVKLLTNRDTVGWGEITGKRGVPESIEEFKQLEQTLNDCLRGLDPFNVLQAHQRLLKVLPPNQQANPIRCGIDIALHDLVGKSLGVSVGTLLGGVHAAEIPIAYPIPAHRHESEIDQSIQYMGEMLDRGFERVRFYIGLDLEVDALCLERMRETFGSRVRIKTLDCNFHMDWQESLTAIERFSEYGFEFVESPAKKGDVEGVARVRRSIDHLVSDHAYTLNQAYALLKHDAVDILNITTVSAGGIRAGQKIAALAEAAGAHCVLGAAHEMSLGTAAQAHLGSTLTILDFPSDAIGPEIYEQDIVVTPLSYASGNMLVPTGPGIGLEVDEAKLSALTERPRV
jgi:galactarate dehydratase (D-threo-forming)